MEETKYIQQNPVKKKKKTNIQAKTQLHKHKKEPNERQRKQKTNIYTKPSKENQKKHPINQHKNKNPIQDAQNPARKTHNTNKIDTSYTQPIQLITHIRKT